MKRLVEVAKFAIVGMIATGIHIITGLTLLHGFEFALLSANLLAFCLALGFSYFGHYFWTFQSDTHHVVALPKFFFVAIAAALVNNSLLLLSQAFAFGEKSVVFIVSALVVPALSFVLGRIWVFH